MKTKIKKLFLLIFLAIIFSWPAGKVLAVTACTGTGNIAGTCEYGDCSAGFAKLNSTECEANMLDKTCCANSATITTSSDSNPSPTQTYTPMEAIPGFGRPENFPAYLMAIYNFGLGAIGVSAMFMIVIGGYMYLTSAGNNTQTGKAKEVITDAIAGLILALVSYILLYTINPELVQFKSIVGLAPATTAPAVCSLPPATPGTGGTGTGATDGRYVNYSKACPAGDAVVANSSVATDFSGAAQDSSIQPDPKCNNYDSYFNQYGAQYGVNVKILKTIAQIESTCGTNKQESDAHCCGLMQLDPATASSAYGSPVTCDQLINNDALSVEIAAKYIKQSGYKDDSQKVFAGYNSGYGTSNTADGKKPALAPSSDCPGKSAFECCENPGELKQTIDYVWKAKALMNK